MLSNFLSENFRLKTVQIFEGLPQEELDIILKSGVTHHYRKGEIIFREGGIPTGIFHIERGRVKKFKATSKGGEQIIYICSQGELLGYHSLLSEDRYPDSASALVNSEIMFIPKEPFLQVLGQSSILSNKLIKALGHEFSLFINNFTNLATKTVRERLAFNLLVLEEKFKSKDSDLQPVDIEMSRADLASMIGTAKETLVRLLRDFKQKKLIQTTSKTVRIIDRTGVIMEANFIGKSSVTPKTKRNA